MRGSVIFDMDGVLIDSQPLHFSADSRVIRASGGSPAYADVERLTGVALRNRCAIYKEQFRLERPVDELISTHVSILMRLFQETDLRPINGIPELLIMLRGENIKTAVASSSSMELIRLVLEKLRLSEYFSALITTEEVKDGKPAPDIFLKAAEAIDSQPEDCAVIEDSANGVLAAKRAGMFCVAYQNPTSGYQDLSPADMIIYSFNEINNNLLWLNG